MLDYLIVLSGTVGSGKSSLAKSLSSRFDVPRLSTRELIQELRPGVGDDRKGLQQAGAELDEETGGAWVSRGVSLWLAQQDPKPRVIVLDAVKQEHQINLLRKQYPTAVFHIHVDAEVGVRRARYAVRHRVGDDYDFNEVISDSIESRVHQLGAIADIALDSTRISTVDLSARVAGATRLFGQEDARLVDVVVGGQWGSEGKGQIAAHLAPEYQILLRVGGPNAGHSVYEEPKPLKFFHLPSGWGRNRTALMVLGPGTVINVDTLLEEIQTHEVPEHQLRIDPLAVIVRPEDIEAEFLLEQAIGSTKRGVGAATSRKVMRVEGSKDHWRPVGLAKDHTALQRYLGATLEILEKTYATGQKVLLEGTQGTLLSLHHGSFPYVTSRDTSVSGCLSEAGVAIGRVRKVIMVCRTYPIRVRSPDEATSGPMGPELTWTEISARSGIPVSEFEERERGTTTNRLRRVAEFCWNDVRRASLMNSPTDIALTFADYLGVENRKARRFEQLNPETRAFIEGVEQLTGAPVSLIAKEFNHSPIIDRRFW